MSTTIEQYRDAKSHYLRLRAEAKKDLLRRFQELANELLLIQSELAEDFGHKVPMPAKGKKPKRPAPAAATPAAKAKGAVSKISAVAAKEAPLFSLKSQDLSAEEANIMKHIEKNRKKLAEAQAAGKPTKAVEDRIYELEDELRLVQAK